MLGAVVILLVPCFESVYQARRQHYRLLGGDGGEGAGRSGGMWTTMPKAQCSLCGGVQMGIGPRATLMVAGSGLRWWQLWLWEGVAKPLGALLPPLSDSKIS